MKVDEHPLFPVVEGEDPPPVEYIHITRFRADGGPVYHRHRFGAEELVGLDQISDTFGGGTYELIAYADGRISARRRYTFDGKPRPMNPEQPPDDGEDVSSPPPTPVYAQAPPTNDLMPQLFQLLIATLQSSAQQNANLIQLLLTQGTQQTQAHVQTMAQLYERSAARDAEIFRLMADMGKGGGSKEAVETLLRGLEIGQSLGGAEDADDNLLENVGNVAAAVTAGLNLAKQNAPPNGGAAPSIPPVGGAVP